jgi:hypothetical protein
MIAEPNYLELEVLRHALGPAEGVDADELELDVLLEQAGQDARHLRRRRRPEHLYRHLLRPPVDRSAAAAEVCETIRNEPDCWVLWLLMLRVGFWMFLVAIYTHPKGRRGIRMPLQLASQQVHTGKSEREIKRQSADSKKRPQVCRDAVVCVSWPPQAIEARIFFSLH